MKHVVLPVIFILLTACAPAPTQTSEVSKTSEVSHALATAEVTVTSTAATSEETATAKPAPSPTPETLLPPDFTVANWTEFRTKILPYCYARADLSDSKEGVDKVKAMLQGSEILKMLMDKFNRGEIVNLGWAVAPADGGGGCAMISVYEKDPNITTSGYFQSKFDQTWIEVPFTEFQ